MSLAERLYKESATENYETPPLWLDISFIIITSAIHIFYAFKFTKFSLSYLNAKCDEKQSHTKWSPSKIYLWTISSYGQSSGLVSESNIKMHLNNISLWTQLALLRNILRILIFVLCWVVLILYIILSLNILFEYLIASIVNYKNGSFLALIALPPFLFINIVIIKSIFFGIMASWSINTDIIADKIAKEKKEENAKLYAFRNGIQISSDQYAHDINMKPMKPILSASVSAEQQEIKEEKKEENVEEIKLETEAKSLSFRQKLWTPYFMAVHWRLIIICCAILSTMIALPTMKFEGDDVLITDTFWLQIFLRYLLIAVTLWLFIYVMISLLFALFGRISTISVYSEMIDEEKKENKGSKATNYKKRMKDVLRFFCLLDVFSLSDTHFVWTRCKILTITLLLLCGVLFVIIGYVTDYGLIWFVGVVFIVYHGVNIILTSKPRGLHYLWKGDINALELDMEYASHSNNDLSATTMLSHASNMVHLTESQLKTALSRHISVPNQTAVEMPELQVSNKGQSMDTDDENTDNVQSRSRRSTIQNEEDVIDLFCRLHHKIKDERQKLYEERGKLRFGELCRDSLCCCCPGIVRPINCMLLFNFIYSIFKEYKGYWLLILPYDYEIRPLSRLEKIFKFNYKNNSIQQIFKSIWNGIKGIVCFIVIVIMLFLMLWISLNINKSESVDVESEILTQNINIATSSYPVCDIKWNANLSVLDLTSISHLSHEIGKREDIISIQDMICLYFDGDTNKCQWKIHYISREEPVFMHLRHEMNKTDVIAIRGTESNLDALQDFNLFNQVALLQTASWIVPITSLLPRSFIIQIVYFMSLFEGGIDTQIRQRYDVPVFEYTYNLLKDTKYPIDSLYLLGHSLGGFVGQAVVGQLHHLYDGYIINDDNKYLLSDKFDLKSFSYGSPGLTFNSRKFSLDLNDLYDTATLLKITHDPISNIDLSGGLVQNLACSESSFYQCHKRKHIICELATKCGFYISNNPEIIKKMCINKNIKGMKGSYVTYMTQLYNVTINQTNDI